MGAESIRLMHPLFQTEEGGETPTSALQLVISEVDLNLAIRLNRHWHSVLPEISKLSCVTSKYLTCHGAGFNGVWYASAIWTHAIAANRLAHGSSAVELRWFAIAPDAPPSTASRILAVMARHIRNKFPDATRLISYQAVEHHAGTIYKAAGWTPACKSAFVPWKFRGVESEIDSAGRSRPGRRKAAQTTSPKVRWEKWLVDSTSLPPAQPRLRRAVAEPPSLFPD